MGENSLRRSCEDMVDDLVLPWPFSAEALCEQTAEERGRPIRLHPHTFPTDGVSGLCISTDTADHIFYEQHTSGLHREHIILHELGHLLWGHGQDDEPIDERLLPRTVRSSHLVNVLARDRCAGEKERAAELFAVLVLDRVRRGRGRSEVPETDTVLMRMRRLFGS